MAGVLLPKNLQRRLLTGKKWVRVLGALEKKGLLWVAFMVYFIRWYRGLKESLRIAHQEKAHPVIMNWKQQSKALAEGYSPTAWMSFGSQFLAGSLHTLWHNILRRTKPLPEVTYERELFTLECGGTVGLDWAVECGGIIAPPKDDHSKTLVLLHHGLAGCSRSHYVMSMVYNLLKTGKFRVCVMVARGCGEVPMTTVKGFCAAGYKDLWEVVEDLKKRNENSHIYGVGYSLGACLFSSYIGRSGKDCKLSGAVVASPCWDFHKTSPYFEIWSRKFLAASLKDYTAKNKHVIGEHPDVDLHKALAAVNTREFDEHCTIRSWGFESVDHYYSEASPIHFAQDIHIPTLALSADDDPVCSVEGAEIIEEKQAFGPGLVIARTKRGGHVSWAEGTIGYESYMDRVIMEWIDTCEAHYNEQSEKVNA